MNVLKACLPILLLTCSCASIDHRQPSSSDDSYQNNIQRLLPAGEHNGVVPGSSEKCRVQANYGMEFNISGSYRNFENGNREGGSQACMYTQACFALGSGGSLSPKVLESENSDDHVKAKIKQTVPEGGGTTTMMIELQKENNGLTVTIEEGVGVFHLGTTSLSCHIGN